MGRRLPLRGRDLLSRPTGSRSLFWTFAGVFLAVLSAATVLEVVLVAAVLRPMATQRTREQAELAVDRAARAIAALYDPYDLAELHRVLRASRPPDRDAFLALVAWDGRVVGERPVAADLRARLLALVPGAAAADSASAGGRPESAERGPPLALLAHRPVVIDGRRFGEVAALGPPLEASLWALPETRTLALFLPFAVLAAGAAGLLMVRILAARLRALEQVAARVIGGELDARIETSGADEIGRLEARVNRMTERLAAARDRLERTDRERRRLFADITHELATPLTSIRGYVETLLDAGVPVSDAERRHYLADVLAEARRLDRLVAELLELTRLEAGATPLELERLDWASLNRNAARRMAPRFAAAGLTLAAEGIASGAWVRADGRRLEQVIDNLLANALRYVPAGGHVQVAVEAAAPEEGSAGAGTGAWRLMIRDDGPGFAPADLPHLFERFYRAPAVRDQDGTGLGLAIVREIVLQHGGRVRAEAREPRGAAFVITLPAVA